MADSPSLAEAGRKNAPRNLDSVTKYQAAQKRAKMKAYDASKQGSFS